MTSVRRCRRGAALAFTLGVVTVLSMIALLVARSFVALHEQRRQQERELQADFLVESGLERGAARLAGDASYQGEAWELPSRESQLAADAHVLIEIAEREGEKHIHVKATYGKAARQATAERKIVWKP
jgi:type II secretory pathway component PulK